MSTAVEFYPDHGVAYSAAAGGTLFALGDGAAPGGRSASPVPSQAPQGAPTGVAPWGDDNQLPQQILAELEKNPTLASALAHKASRVLAGEFCYGAMVPDGKGGLKRVREYDVKVEQWLYRANLSQYFRHSPLELYRFWNVYPELVVSADRSEIAQIVVQESAFARLSVQDTSGQIRFVYLSADWDKSPGIDKCITRSVLDPEAYDRETIVREGNAASYIYPLKGPDSGKIYYHRHPWHGLLSKGTWLDLANRIPKFKVAILKNQMTIKYHVKVPDWWWRERYADWDEQPKLKATRQKDELEQFNKFVQGEEAAGRSIMTTVKTDPTGKAFDGWVIEAIKDKFESGTYVEDSQEAYSHLFFSVGVDASLIGATPGKGMGAGSGSDKRVADNIADKNARPDQRLLLEPIAFAFAYNGFKSSNGLPYVLWIENEAIQTLDTGKNTTPAAPPTGDKPAAA